MESEQVAVDCPKMLPIERKTEQELRQLAIDIHEGKVFGSWNVHQHDNNLLPNIFMVLIFLESEPPANAGHVYEYLAKANQMGINGYPTFFSLNWLAKEDVEPLMTLINELRSTRESFMVGEQCPSDQE